MTYYLVVLSLNHWQRRPRIIRGSESLSASSDRSPTGPESGSSSPVVEPRERPTQCRGATMLWRLGPTYLGEAWYCMLHEKSMSGREIDLSVLPQYGDASLSRPF